MTNVIIQQVDNHQQRRRFATFPWQVYRHDPLWVPPLIPERMKQLDPQKGTFFKHGRLISSWPTGMGNRPGRSWRRKTGLPIKSGD